MFRVGDSVRDVLQGRGTVVRDDYSDALPLLVRFDSCPSPTAYTADGKRDPGHLYPSLHRLPRTLPPTQRATK